ncbi:MAG: hypothetical protein COW75_02730 [Rhodobacterales bacterium CG18_big_fil_WC_8_21_14_2_50_71_9]|nr:MAG: hypothetical protein COW75_02730 [Rhodobacterales bacterium CG18_big_fil_WC_8_21_14_2_50_71_9]PIY73544.1 MAG: OmpW family protein [Rhodobacterales bacterium CG_4_10_14_0_8_um_filter_70_9]
MKTLFCAGAALCLLAAGQAAAQEPWYAAKSDGDWLVRLRGIAVVPDESLTLDQIAGADADVDTAYMPELDISYFFTPNLALELILATTPHDVAGRGSLNGANLGDVWLLPPTLTAQYHVTQLGAWTGNPALGKIKPYFGAGINYTIFYNTDSGQFDKIDYDDTFGWALQAGVDIALQEGLYLNFDVKKLWLETDVTVTSGATRLTGEVTLDPWIFGVGVGYRF